MIIGILLTKKLVITVVQLAKGRDLENFIKGIIKKNSEELENIEENMLLQQQTIEELLGTKENT